jgi:hypothetical protein
MSSSGDCILRNKVGFHVRNRFQIGHFLRLFAAFDDAVWICNSRSLRMYLKGLGYNNVMRPGEVRKGVLDVLLMQGGIELFMQQSGCRLVMVQYGYAKAPYNFGLWRAAADVVFAYGPYALNRFAHLTQAESVGNPRWDDFLDTAFQQRARDRYFEQLTNGLPVVVYAPTWGELSSVTEWMGSVLQLSRVANVFVKMHHNTAKRQGSIPVEETCFGRIHFVPDDDLFELLVCADILISDFSGAIFDALLCETPVVLLDKIDGGVQSGKKLDDLSPEITQRQFLGRQVSVPSELVDVVREVLADPAPVLLRASALRDVFFDVRPGVCERIVKACQQNILVPVATDVGQMTRYVHMGAGEMMIKLSLAKRLLRFSVFFNAILLLVFALMCVS